MSRYENRTADDAVGRIAAARCGSLIDPTFEYLAALRTALYGWLEEVEPLVLALHPLADDDAGEAVTP